MAQKGDTFQVIGVLHDLYEYRIIDPFGRDFPGRARNSLDARFLERAQVPSDQTDWPKKGVPTVVLFIGFTDKYRSKIPDDRFTTMLKKLKMKNYPAILWVVIAQGPLREVDPFDVSRKLELADFYPVYRDALGLDNVTAVAVDADLGRLSEQNAPANDAIWRWVQEHDLRFKAERARFGLALVAENAPSTLTQLATENGMDESDMKALLSNIFESRFNPRPARKRVAVVGDDDDGDESGSASVQPPLKRSRTEVAAALIARRGNVDMAAQDLMRDG
jgi:hypothetical protein